MKVADSSSRSVQEKSKKLLFDSLQKKTSYYLSKPALEDSDLYYYVKDFFREYLDIAHELSFDEIKREIDKIYIEHEVKQSVNSFIDKIKGVEYKESLFDENKIKSLINEFYGIVKSLREEEKKEQSSFKRFLKSLGLSNNKPEVNNNEINTDSVDKKSVSELVTNIEENIPEAENNESKALESTNNFEEKILKSVNNIDENIPESALNDKVNDESVSDKKSENDFEVPDLEDNNNSFEPKRKSVQKLSSKKSTVKDSENERIKKNDLDFSNVELDDDFSKDVSLTKINSGNIDGDDWTEHVHDLNKFNNKEKTNDDTEDTDLVSENAEVDLVSENSSSKENDAPLFEEDVYALIAHSKRVKNKNQLTQLYKEINDLYETKSVEEQSKIYPDLISLYNKLTVDSQSSFSDDEPPVFEEEDIYALIETSKKTKNVNQLTQLYKEINDLYETKSIEEQSKIYPELINLYKKISKK